MSGSPTVGPLSPDAYVDVLAETGMGMVCVLDLEGRVVVFDEACERATGFASADVVGRDARETVIPPEEAVAFGAFLEQLTDAASPSPQVGHWMTADGERRMIAWSNRPLLDESGEVMGLLTVGIDLTERARLQTELEVRLAEQAALRRVATLVAGEAGDLVLDVVSVEVGRLFGALSAAVVRFDGDEGVVVGRWHDAEVDATAVGSRFTLSEDYAAGRVHRTGEPARVDAFEHAPVPEGLIRSAAAPVAVAGRTWGALVVATDAGGTLPPETERRLGAFADLISLAIASADAREQLIASRARLVAAADDERRRLERDLHDGAQQRLVTLALNLGVARRHLPDGAERVDELLDAAERDAREALAELRHLATGLHPPVLSERGLAGAVGALARRAPLPVEVEHVPDERFSPTLEVAAYYVVAEALTNVAKHAQATEVRVAVRREGDRLVLWVADDGRGGANPRGGTGLVGLTDRVEALRGSLDITSSETAGTTLRAEFPLD